MEMINEERSLQDKEKIKKRKNRCQREKETYLQSKEKGWMPMFVNDSIFSVKLEVTYALTMEVSNQDMVAFGRLGKV